MRFTIEEDRQAIKRYAHIRPARGRRTRSCAARCPGSKRTCTLERDHRGPHVAHGFLGKVVAVWEAPPEARVSEAAIRRASESRAGSALRTRRQVGALEAFRKRAARIFSKVPQIAMLIMFLAFVGFAIDWFLRIIG